VDDIDTIGNPVVLVLVVVVVVVVASAFNAQTFERITFAFPHSIVISQFIEFSHDLQLCQFGRRT